MSLPTGPRVTFLFTDIEGSTRLERSLGSAPWSSVVADHDRRVRRAIEGHRGVVVKTEGDAFFAAFAEPADALAAIIEAQRAIAAGGWGTEVDVRVRAGLHLGEGTLRERDPAHRGDEDYVGIDVNYAARIAAAANGGQVLVSDALARSVAGDAGEAGSANGASLVDEGLRIVKDFEEPTRLHRLVVPGAADDRRPLRTLEAPSNLPHETTPLIGREAEVEAISAALLETRVVTLSGPGGSGKTRLAIAVAEFVRSRFAHGVWFIDFAAISDPALIESTIAATIGLRESAGQAFDDLVRMHLRDREALLLLDNLEQLLPDAATRVATLVRFCPAVRVLVTSRELLRISGERGYVVPPLDVEAGVRLFEDRARALRPDFATTPETASVIRAIAERLGGLPLAIELAAARTRLMQPAAILERLGRSLDLAGSARDVPERQRTLRAAIDWSHELLNDDERTLFRRVAVFAGGWTTDDAQAVVDGSGPLEFDLVAGLESLADKSLVRVEPGAVPEDVDAWFSEHPLLREYGQERLEASGERPTREARHAAVCAELAEAEGGAFLPALNERALRRFDREQHNFRAAIDWSIRTGDVEVGLRIASATWRWYIQRGRLREGRGQLGQLLDNDASRRDPRLRIAGLTADGGLAYWMNDFDGARARYEERLALAESIGDPRLEADANYDIGFIFLVAQEGERLRAYEQKALDLYEALGDEDGIVRARQAVGLSVFLGGDYRRALELEDANLEVFRRRGSHFQVADSVTFHAGVHFRLREPAEAWAWMTEGLRFFVANDSASGLARSLGMAAIIQLGFGDPEFGARITGATYEIVREKGVMVAPVHVLHLPDPRETAAEKLGAERAAELMAEGAGTPLSEIVAAVLAAPTPGTAEVGGEAAV
ncbi:MAG: adenylate/guanylate cyclase domain-containing protein [Chloroflexota bacterium]